MAKAKKPVNELENILKRAAENYTYQTMMGCALSFAILQDYAELVSEMEGVEPDEVAQRIMGLAQAMLQKQGWAVYAKETENGTVPALGMIWHDMMIKTAPVPVLKMPMQVDNEKPVKKKRKRYI